MTTKQEAEAAIRRLISGPNASKDALALVTVLRYDRANRGSPALNLWIADICQEAKEQWAKDEEEFEKKLQEYEEQGPF